MIYSPRGTERECFPGSCLSPVSNAFAISIANSSFASAVRMSGLCLMAVFHNTGLEKPENLAGSRIS